jgi:regulator of sigma D
MCQQVWLFTRYSPVLGIESNVLLNKKVVRNSMRHACEYLVQVLMKEKFSVYDAFFRKMISIIYRLLLTHPRSQGFSAAILVFL